ncbi:hypothetical protein JVU11DRAFT_10165 [Chiua virens]|nr:hypothetical protein JVU11DRAFT_10165 [Chiua virens]
MIQVGSSHNQSVAWHHNGKHLFVASEDGHIHHLVVSSTCKRLAKWRIHSDNNPECIALSSDSTYIAASARQSVSFWDAVTHEQIGLPVEEADIVSSLAVSPNHDMAVGMPHTITLRNLRNILPAHYYATRDLYNKLMDVRNRYDMQSRQLRDHKVTALTAELDRRKRSIAIQTDKLVVVRQELERLPDVSYELLSVRRDLRTLEDRMNEMHQQYQVQLNEVTSVVAQYQPQSPPIHHNSITDWEVYAEKAFIRTLESLNTDVGRTSVSISTYLIRHINSPSCEEQSSAIQRASKSIPQSLVDGLRTSSHHNVVSHLQIAFRAYLTAYLYGIISLWTTDKRTDELLSEMYGRLYESGSQTFAANWRSLAHTNMASDDSDTLVSRAIQGLADIAVTAGCAASTPDTESKISHKFWHNISSMVATAEKLREMIGEDIKANLKVVVVRPAQTFDGNSMIVDAGNRGSGVPFGIPRGKKVLCTTRLGLIKEINSESANPGLSNGLTTVAVVKASVVLAENGWG